MLAPLLALAMMTATQANPAPATNTKCPVTGEAVTDKSQIVVVQGRSYRICCPGCDTKLLKDPAKYLEKDGTPKNAPKPAGQAMGDMPGMHKH